MKSSSVFNRGDTLFGVCEALGQDFGFNPQWLRVALAVLLLVNPAAVIGGYFAAGALVALSRLLAPAPKPASASAAEPAEAIAEPEPLAEAA
jgi:phage shock protein PspC (stress-responsive transcriptional regulator)